MGITFICFHQTTVHSLNPSQDNIEGMNHRLIACTPSAFLADCQLRFNIYFKEYKVYPKSWEEILPYLKQHRYWENDIGLYDNISGTTITYKYKSDKEVYRYSITMSSDNDFAISSLNTGEQQDCSVSKKYHWYHFSDSKTEESFLEGKINKADSWLYNHIYPFRNKEKLLMDISGVNKAEAFTYLLNNIKKEKSFENKTSCIVIISHMPFLEKYNYYIPEIRQLIKEYEAILSTDENESFHITRSITKLNEFIQIIEGKKKPFSHNPR